MTEHFDIVLIGAGPCAVACLDALGKHRRIALVTGATEGRFDSNLAHPKIQTVALENGERPGLGVQFENAQMQGKSLFSTAIKGGLANYWGQQFVPAHENDPYPRNLFTTYKTYRDDCGAIESRFNFQGGESLARPSALPAGYSMRAPKLMTGTTAFPSDGLMSMRRAVEDLSSGVTVFSLRAERFVRTGPSSYTVHLSDGRTIEAPKILLAAGVLGTAQLVMNSFDDIAGASFSDHAPYMLYATWAQRLLKLRPVEQRRHFNALTIEQQVDGKSRMFASVYDMGAAELNLLLATAIGRAYGFLRGFSAPLGASLLQPVQVWTERSFAHLQIDARTRRFSGSVVENAEDTTFKETGALLKRLGARVLHWTRTSPGAGFHYHALSLTAAGRPAQSIADLLRERTAGALACVDASILPTIGLRPHTLTAMAAARRSILSDENLR